MDSFWGLEWGQGERDSLWSSWAPGNAYTSLQMITTQLRIWAVQTGHYEGSKQGTGHLEGASQVGIGVCFWRTSRILAGSHGGHDSLAERAAKARDRKVVGLFHPSPVVPSSPVFRWGNWGSPNSFNLLRVRFFLLCDYSSLPRVWESCCHPFSMPKCSSFFPYWVWPGPSHQLPGSHFHPSHPRAPLCHPQRGLGRS